MRPISLVELSKFNREKPQAVCVYESDDLSLYMWCLEEGQQTDEISNKKTDELVYLAGGRAEIVFHGNQNFELKDLMLVPVLREIPYFLHNPGPGRAVVLSYKKRVKR